MHARRLPAHRVHASGVGPNVLAIPEQSAEQSPRHRASANVARADKKDVFHNLKKQRRRRFREGKIKLNQVNASTFAPMGCSGFRLTTVEK
jgi:hypothetical protein